MRAGNYYICLLSLFFIISFIEGNLVLILTPFLISPTGEMLG